MAVRRKAAELSSTLDERDAKIQDIKQRLKSFHAHAHGGRHHDVIDSDVVGAGGGAGDAQQQHGGGPPVDERTALAVSLKKLMADQVRRTAAGVVPGCLLLAVDSQVY